MENKVNEHGHHSIYQRIVLLHGLALVPDQDLMNCTEMAIINTNKTHMVIQFKCFRVLVMLHFNHKCMSNIVNILHRTQNRWCLQQIRNISQW